MELFPLSGKGSGVGGGEKSRRGGGGDAGGGKKCPVFKKVKKLNHINNSDCDKYYSEIRKSSRFSDVTQNPRIFKRRIVREARRIPSLNLLTFIIFITSVITILDFGVLHVECLSPSHNSNNNNQNSNINNNNNNVDSAVSATTVSSSSALPSSASVSHPVIAGAAMHLFPRYGYLSLSMRVVPRNDTQNWIFLEPSKDVFVPSTTKVQEQSFTASDNSLPLHNEFHIDLCEDIQQLIQAYFRRFIIEGLQAPWHAFAGGWRTPSLAKYFGIDPVFIKGDYRYMLVRVLMVRKAGRLTPLQNVTVTPPFQEHVNSFRVKDYPSSFSFFNEVGTHYINSFLTGNSIYQVFVYDQQGYDAVKRRLSETGWVRSSYMAQLPYLLPLWVKHMGKVMLLNSNPQTTQNVREALTIRFLFSVYPNIFKMHDNSDLVRLIEKYLKSEPDGLLGLELKTLDVVFRDPSKRQWFIESLQQTQHLWEVNLR